MTTKVQFAANRPQVLDGPEQSARAGAQLGEILASRPAGTPAWLLTLRGELGSGKTTLAGAILKTLGHADAAPSPTFSLAEHYPLPGGDCWHLDLYRLEKPEDARALGLDEMLIGADTLLLVEWPEKAGDLLPEPDMDVLLEHGPGSGRTMTLQRVSPRACELLKCS